MPGPKAATVSDQLRQAILDAAERGITRYRIAKETGVSQAALSRFVSRGQNIDLPSFDSIAAYLGLTLTQAKPAPRK